MTIALGDEPLHATHDDKSYDTSTEHKCVGIFHIGSARFFIQRQFQLQKRPP